MPKNLAAMTTDELRAELKRLKENLCDLEETHSFTFGKTSVHIGAERANALQAEFEEECGSYSAEIAAVEAALKTRGV